MYAELFSGMGLNPEQAIDTVFNEQTTDPVVMRHVHVKVERNIKNVMVDEWINMI